MVFSQFKFPANLTQLVVPKMHCLYANAVVQPNVQHCPCDMAWKTKVHTWCRHCHLCINAPMWREKKMVARIYWLSLVSYFVFLNTMRFSTTAFGYEKRNVQLWHTFDLYKNLLLICFISQKLTESSSNSAELNFCAQWISRNIKLICLTFLCEKTHNVVISFSFWSERAGI